MSVKNLFDSLNFQKSDLARQIDEILKTLESLKAEEDTYTKKIQALKERHSLLAKQILFQSEKDLATIRAKYESVENDFNCLIQKFNAISQKLSDIENDFTRYITEQSDQMVNAILSYIDKNQLAIGNKITSVFKFHVNESFMASPPCFFPTGILQILYDSRIIAVSSDFYFKTKLYKFDEKTGKVEYTEWFYNFLNYFKSVFFAKLKECFSKSDLSEYFELAITPEFTNFTLELR